VMLGPHEDTYVVDWGLVSIAPGVGHHLDLPEIAMLDVVQALPETIDTLLQGTPEAVTVAGSGGPNKVLGTPLYMSPEQAADDREVMGPPSDVWALGVMLFEALCDMHPYVDDPSASNLEILTSTLTTAIPPVARVAPGVPPQLAALCDAMLAHDSAARPAASEVLAALRPPARSRGSGAGPSASPPVAAIGGAALHASTTLLHPSSKTIVGDPRARSSAVPAPAGPSLATPGIGAAAPARREPSTRPIEAIGIGADDRTPVPAANRGDGAPMIEHRLPGTDRTVAIVSPAGYRLEGITVEEALAILKALAG